jgi:hypothetical protein
MDGGTLLIVHVPRSHVLVDVHRASQVKFDVSIGVTHRTSRGVTRSTLDRSVRDLPVSGQCRAPADQRQVQVGKM